MPQPLIYDELWKHIEPLLPKKRRRKRHAGRLPLCNRRVLTGIVFVLRSGIPWEMPPKEMGCGSGMTCWRRVQAVAASARLGSAAPNTARQVAERGKAGLFPGHRRQLFHTRRGRGEKVDRTQPIAVVRAASTTSSRTPKVSRFR